FSIPRPQCPTLVPYTTLFRSHQDAPAGPVEQKVQAAEHQGPERDQQKLILGKALAEDRDRAGEPGRARPEQVLRPPDHDHHLAEDRKSTRLNSSHVKISYAVF